MSWMAVARRAACPRPRPRSCSRGTTRTTATFASNLPIRRSFAKCSVPSNARTSLYSLPGTRSRRAERVEKHGRARAVRRGRRRRAATSPSYFQNRDLNSKLNFRAKKGSPSAATLESLAASRSARCSRSGESSATPKAVPQRDGLVTINPPARPTGDRPNQKRERATTRTSDARIRPRGAEWSRCAHGHGSAFGAQSVA